jgi:predicted solute-binding protein
LVQLNTTIQLMFGLLAALWQNYYWVNRYSLESQVLTN